MKITKEYLQEIIKEEIGNILYEESCAAKAKRKFKKFPSKYAGYAIAKCKKGEIWENEMSDELEEAYTEDGQHACSECLREYIDKHADLLTEAKYQGKEVPLGKPMAGDVKKSKVYVKNPTTGNVVKVNFGDKNMRIKKSNPNRRRSFRARHHCENPGPKTKARYWSCRAW